MKVLRRIREAFIYQKVLKLANDGQYAQALGHLSGFEGRGEYISKRVLLEAVLHYRMRDFDRAESLTLIF